MMKHLLKNSIALLLVLSLVFGGINTQKLQAVQPDIEELVEEALRESRIKAEQIQRDSRMDKAVTFNQEDMIELMLLLEDGTTTLTEEQKTTIMNQTLEALKTIPTLEVGRQYTDLLFGLSVKVQYQYYDQVKQIETIKMIRLSNQYMPSIASNKSITQTDQVLQDYGMKGEGVVVAIVDSGIDYNHKDMVITTPGAAKLSEADVQSVISSGELNATEGRYYTAKVPFGYNYADKNTEVRDTVSPNHEHGMHVAGIVGANGAEAGVANGTSVVGVAPETQVLAMKVFPNSTTISYATTEDIIAAIEDAVVLGADVINLSLGAAAGFQDSTDIEQLAVQRATEAGVVVVISAGNSSFATSGVYDPTVKDEGTVGSPASATDVIMVANFEGNEVVSSFIQYCGVQADGQGGCTGGPYQETGINFEANVHYDYVNAGIGKAEEVTDVSGKVALIERGELTFAEKVMNAQNAGAIGVVVYNHAEGGETLISMALDPGTTIPVVFVGHSTGLGMIDFMNSPNHASTYLLFPSEKMSTENPNAGRFDESTSWGTTPNLSFKPEIAAPGGDIYSTTNNNGYTTMSGTSMSAPHVSGAVALVIQKIKQDHPNITGQELTKLVKNLVMNTASVVEDPDHTGIPYSPRRQGAGLIQTKDMMLENSTITNTVNRKAAIEFGMMTQSQNAFQVEVKNFGSAAQTYTYKGATILTGANDFSMTDGQPYDQILNGASITGGSLTVEPGQAGIMDLTLTLPATPIEGYVEGFMTFEVDGRELNVPFIGYYGDFGKLPMFTQPVWAENKTYYDLYDNGALKSVGVYYDPVLEGFYYLNNEANKMAISPNEDGFADNMIPATYMIRNAKTVDALLYNEQGELVKKVGTTENVRRQIFGTTQQPIADLISFETMWFGDDSNGQVVQEGHYRYVLEGSSDLPNASKQQLEFPITVDVTPPTVEFIGSVAGVSPHLPNVLVTNQDTYELVWTASDNLTGVEGLMLTVNGEIINTDIYYDQTTNQYSAMVPVGIDYNVIVVAPIDGALNIGGYPVVVKRAAYDAPVLVVDQAFTSGTMVIDENHPGKTVEVGVGSEKEIGSIKINGQELMGDAMAYSTSGVISIDKASLVQGVNPIALEAYDYASTAALIQPSGTTNLFETPFRTQIFYDTQAPTIKGYSVNNLGNGEASVTATVGDSSKVYKVYVNQTEVSNVTTVDSTTITYKLKATEGQNIELKVVDVTGKAAVETKKLGAANLPETGLSTPIYGIAGLSVLAGVLMISKKRRIEA